MDEDDIQGLRWQLDQIHSKHKTFVNLLKGLQTVNKDNNSELLRYKKQMKFLKNEAPVVSLAEYKLIRESIKFHQTNTETIKAEIRVHEQEIRSCERDINLLSRILKKEESEARKRGKVLKIHHEHHRDTIED